MDRPGATAMCLTTGTTKPKSIPTKQTTPLTRKHYVKLQPNVSPARHDRSKIDERSSKMYGASELHNQEEPAMTSGQLRDLGVCLSPISREAMQPQEQPPYLDDAVVLVKQE